MKLEIAEFKMLQTGRVFLALYDENGAPVKFHPSLLPQNKDTRASFSVKGVVHFDEIPYALCVDMAKRAHEAWGGMATSASGEMGVAAECLPLYLYAVSEWAKENTRDYKNHLIEWSSRRLNDAWLNYILPSYLAYKYEPDNLLHHRSLFFATSNLDRNIASPIERERVVAIAYGDNLAKEQERFNQAKAQIPWFSKEDMAPQVQETRVIVNGQEAFRFKKTHDPAEDAMLKMKIRERQIAERAEKIAAAKPDSTVVYDVPALLMNVARMSHSDSICRTDLENLLSNCLKK